MKALTLDDWTAAGATVDNGDRQVAMSRLVLQTSPGAIEPLPPSPLPPLRELTWLSRLGQPPHRPMVPWAALLAFLVTLAGMALSYGLR